MPPALASRLTACLAALRRPQGRRRGEPDVAARASGMRVIGPNGAGKTTLFNVISGELPADERHASCLFGDDITTPGAASAGGARHRQDVSDHQALSRSHRARERAAGLRGARPRRKFTMVSTAARRAPISWSARRACWTDSGCRRWRTTRARHLSYGDQRKLEVALSMAGRPRLLLLDEPMAGLSSPSASRCRRSSRQLDPAIAVLLIEHDMDMAFGFAERVTVLHQGRVLAEGSCDEISANRDGAGDLSGQLQQAVRRRQSAQL